MRAVIMLVGVLAIAGTSGVGNNELGRRVVPPLPTTGQAATDGVMQVLNYLQAPVLITREKGVEWSKLPEFLENDQPTKSLVIRQIEELKKDALTLAVLIIKLGPNHCAALKITEADDLARIRSGEQRFFRKLPTDHWERAPLNQVAATIL